MSMTPEAEDFFRSRLDQIIDLRHPLAKLASRMPWQEIEASIAQLFASKARAGKRIDDVDLFGSTSTLVGGGISNAGRPRMPLRLMVSLLYLKHAYNESDEGPSNAGESRRSGSIFRGETILSTNCLVTQPSW